MAINRRIEELLQAVGLPLAYRQFEPYKDTPVPSPPYLIYLIDKESGHGADGLNFYKQLHITVELYTTKKDTELENKVEVAINEYEFEKYEDYLDNEYMWFISYEFDVYEKIRRS